MYEWQLQDKRKAYTQVIGWLLCWLSHSHGWLRVPLMRAAAQKAKQLCLQTSKHACTSAVRVYTTWKGASWKSFIRLWDSGPADICSSWQDSRCLYFHSRCTTSYRSTNYNTKWMCNVEKIQKENTDHNGFFNRNRITFETLELLWTSGSRRASKHLSLNMHLM